jgi:hypothetical protein
MEKVRLLGPKSGDDIAISSLVLTEIVTPQVPYGLNERLHGREVFGRIAPLEEALKKPGKGWMNPVGPAAVGSQEAHVVGAVEEADAFLSGQAPHLGQAP